jgi:hypothetical protein
MEKKKELLGLVIESFNRKSASVDIGLTEEFDELKRIVKGQEKKI